MRFQDIQEAHDQKLKYAGSLLTFADARGFDGEASQEMVDMWRLDARLLERLPVYVFSKDTFRVIDARAKELVTEDVTTDFDELVFPHWGGWYYFPHRRGEPGAGLPRAIYWAKVKTVGSLAVEESFGDGFHIRVVPFVDWGSPLKLDPEVVAFWNDKILLTERGYQAARYLDRRDVEYEMSPLTATVQFVVASWDYCAQRIITMERGDMSRQTRRRLQREQKPIPETLIVNLRRSELTSKDYDATGKLVEYSHRWIVHAHKRNQWYPSEGKHHEVKIDGYVKGPPDKPLVIKERSYRVSR